MEKGFATVNYRTKLTSNDWEYLYQIFNYEIIQRIALGAGGFGIVDDISPREISTSDVTRPLVVTTNETIPERLDVNAGFAVTDDGNIVFLTAKQYQFALSSYAINSVHVLFIEYILNDSEEKKLNDYNDLAPARTERAPDIETLQSATLTNWNDVTKFSLSRRKNCVSIAVITVVEKTGGGVSLTIDMSGSNYSWNRPWFSLKDIEHRNMKGTGSSDTPHNLGLADLSAGDLTLYSQMLRHGYILSKDNSVSGIAGQRCVETVPSIAVKIDDVGGTKTSLSKYGGPYARYIELLHYPVQIGSVFETASPANSLCVDHIKMTNIIVLAQDELTPDSITVEYSHVYSLEPPVHVNNNEIIFDVPQSWELIISGGKAFNVVSNPKKSFEGYGPVPQIFKMYFDAQGDLIHNPQMVMLATRLDAMGYTPTPLNTTLYDASKIIVGLTRSAITPTMEIILELRGTDVNNTLLIENVTFSGLVWTDNITLPGVYKPDQFIKTINVFKTLTQISVLSRLNDGPNSTIIIYAEQMPYQSVKFNQICEVSEVFWDGLSLTAIKDLRRVTDRLELPTRYYDIDQLTQGIVDSRTLAAIGSTLNSVYEILISEDVRRPRYIETFTDFADAKKAKGKINFTGFNAALVDGDQILLSSTKTITARTGTPNTAIGEFQIGGSDSATRTSMKTTIHDVGFNSGITATDGATDGELLLEKNTAGLSGNYEISVSTFNAGIIAYEGFHYGFDAMAPLQLDRYVDGMAVPIPNSNTSQYPRYQSRSFAITRTFGIFNITEVGIGIYRVTTTLPHDFHNNGLITLWGSDPSDFDGNYAVTNVTPTTFEITATSGLLWLVGGLCTQVFNKFIVFLHGAPPTNPSDPMPVRIRYSNVYRPEVWGTTLVPSAVLGGNCYLFDLLQPVSKVQFEAYGILMGLSAFVVRPIP